MYSIHFMVHIILCIVLIRTVFRKFQIKKKQMRFDQFESAIMFGVHSMESFKYNILNIYCKNCNHHNLQLLTKQKSTY